MEDSKKHHAVTDNNVPSAEPGPDGEPEPAAKKVKPTIKTTPGDVDVAASATSAAAAAAASASLMKTTTTTTKEQKETKATDSTQINDRIGRIQNEFRGVPNSPIWLNIATFLEKDERHRIFPNIPSLKGIERLADAVVDSQSVMEYIKDHNNGKYGRNYYYVHQDNLNKLFPEGLTQFLTDFNDRSKAVPPQKPEQPLKPEQPKGYDEETVWTYELSHEGLRAVATYPKGGTKTFPDASSPEERSIIAYLYYLWDKHVYEKYEKDLKMFKEMTSCDDYYRCYSNERMKTIMEGKDKSLYYDKDPVTTLDVSVSTGTKDCPHADKNHKKTTSGEDISSAIASPTELWIMFGFKGLNWCPGDQQFEEFCVLAGIEEPSKNEIIAFDGKQDGLRIRTWISTDKKVLICMQGGGKRFGCTAERSRGKFLYDWIEKHGSYYEYHSSYRCFV